MSRQRSIVPSTVARALRALDRIARPATAHAHCDIPCGIYDPHLAQIGALTVIRMNQLIDGLQADDAAARNSFSRYVTVKEEHAELVKREVRIIWGDYFKPEHAEKHKDLHATTWNIMKLASQARQQVNMDVAQNLLAEVQKFAEAFWDTKGVATKRQPSNQAVGGELVVPA
ncbi:MAG: superoxide dismutase, Ni [Dehalococcoidia bacterium]